MEKEKIIAKNKERIKKLIRQEIKKNGLNCDLNHINTSAVTDMSCLFRYSNFNGDISAWDVSKVKYMSIMFHNCFAPVSYWTEIKNHEGKTAII